MHHLAIMKKEWGLIPLILSGTKTVESRWYKHKISPWGKLNIGDTIYFKDTGSPVTARAEITGFEQIEVADNNHGLSIMKERAVADLGTSEIPDDVIKYISNKKYALFIHFNNAVSVEPFNISKKGFGMQCAWIVVDDIKRLYAI